jgi:hypothetical protein
MKIKLDTSDLNRLQVKVLYLDKQAKINMVRALNDSAYAAMQAASKNMAQVFDRPTPWVLKSVRYKKATTTKLEAMVDFDAWGNKTGVTASHILQAEIYGGPRKLKRHEVALQRAGILPPGKAIVPGPAAKLDQYGNMSPAQIVQIMSYFKSFGEQGYRANMRDGGKRLAKDNKKKGTRGFVYFAISAPRGKLIPGIYQRFSFGAWGSSVKPIMYFVDIPKYKKRFDFYGVAKRAAREEFAKKMPDYLNSIDLSRA